MAELVRFGIVHALPPVAVFATLNALVKRQPIRLVLSLLGTAAAFVGLALEELWLSEGGLTLLIPPVASLCRALQPKA